MISLKRYDCEKCVFNYDLGYGFACLAEDCKDGSEYYPEYPEDDEESGE